jgi:hypothetical protein
MVTKSKKRKIKNNSFRKNYRKKSKNYRKKRKTYRKSHKISRKNLKKIHKNKLVGTQVAGSHVGPPPEGVHRIGFELEACFDGPVGESEISQRRRYCQGVEDYGAYGSDEALEKIFTKKLLYFEATVDGSIKCSGPGASTTWPELCSMELVLKNDNVFTYNDKQIYMDDNDITSDLIDEILLISSKADACLSDSCGFHVHISETGIGDPRRPGYDYGLNKMQGKLFLLRALALWCGIFGFFRVEGKQDAFIRKGYVREESTRYANLLSPLEPKEFERVYKLSMVGKLTNEGLLDYLKEVYKVAEAGRADVKYNAFNIYPLMSLLRYDEQCKHSVRLAVAEKYGFDTVDAMMKNIIDYDKALSDDPLVADPTVKAVKEELNQGFGFPEKQVVKALAATEGDKEAAIRILVLIKVLCSGTETLSDGLARVVEQRSRHNLSEPARKEYDRIWSNPLRIEFRGHKDLMETIADKTDLYHHGMRGYGVSDEAMSMMIGQRDAELTRNLAKASRFHDHLMEYLEAINLFFTEAKTYEPL